MKAGYYVGDYSYEVRQIAEPQAVGDQVKIRVAWCGLCGTDIHKFQGKNGASPVVPPIILGHECSGIVVATGPDCRHFQPGDRVACDPSYSCGKCQWCQQGLPNFCEERHGVAKGFSEYICPPERNVYPVSAEVSLKAAAFAEPLSCAVHGLDLIKIDSGKSVVLYGMGAIGSLLLQLVKASGAGEIIVVEQEPGKRKLALELGADLAVTDKEIAKISDKKNIDYVIECIGLKETMEQAIQIAGKNAKVLLFGLGDPDQPVSFDQFTAYTKELSIYTSYLNPNTTERAVKILTSGMIDTEKIISAELNLTEIGDELKKLNYSRKGKVMVYLSKEE